MITPLLSSSSTSRRWEVAVGTEGSATMGDGGKEGGGRGEADGSGILAWDGRRWRRQEP